VQPITQININLYSTALQPGISDIIVCDPLEYTFSQSNDEPNLSMSPVYEAAWEEQTNDSTKFKPKDYQLVKRLGRGEFGEVFLATSKSGNSLVMKRINKNGRTYSTKFVDREVNAGKLVARHKHIASYLTRFETANNVYLVFDYFKGLDLITFFQENDYTPMKSKRAKILFKVRFFTVTVTEWAIEMSR
jgi:serine/threonine protein kinase